VIPDIASRIALRVQDPADPNDTNAVYYPLTDHLGSTSVTVYEDGTYYGELRYKPWGAVRWDSANYSGNATPTDFGFTGQRSHESDFGLLFYNARWYDSSLGRFTSADTVVPGAGNPGAWDRYAYVLNSPIGATDPTGHSCSSADGNGNYGNSCQGGQGTGNNNATPLVPGTVYTGDNNPPTGCPNGSPHRDCEPRGGEPAATPGNVPLTVAPPTLADSVALGLNISGLVLDIFALALSTVGVTIDVLTFLFPGFLDNLIGYAGYQLIVDPFENALGVWSLLAVAIADGISGQTTLQTNTYQGASSTELIFGASTTITGVTTAAGQFAPNAEVDMLINIFAIYNDVASLTGNSAWGAIRFRVGRTDAGKGYTATDYLSP